MHNLSPTFMRITQLSQPVMSATTVSGMRSKAALAAVGPCCSRLTSHMACKQARPRESGLVCWLEARRGCQSSPIQNKVHLHRQQQSHTPCT